MTTVMVRPLSNFSKIETQVPSLNGTTAKLNDIIADCRLVTNPLIWTPRNFSRDVPDSCQVRILIFPPPIPPCFASPEIPPGRSVAWTYLHVCSFWRRIARPSHEVRSFTRVNAGPSDRTPGGLGFLAHRQRVLTTWTTILRVLQKPYASPENILSQYGSRLRLSSIVQMLGTSYACWRSFIAPLSARHFRRDCALATYSHIFNPADEYQLLLAPTTQFMIHSTPTLTTLNVRSLSPLHVVRVCTNISPNCEPLLSPICA